MSQGFARPGFVGPTGPTGPTGPVLGGVAGVEGPRGASGLTGPTGYSGLTGVIGVVGVNSVDSGVSGCSGPTGPTGPIGYLSNSGVTGADQPLMSTSFSGEYTYPVDTDSYRVWEDVYQMSSTAMDLSGAAYATDIVIYRYNNVEKERLYVPLGQDIIFPDSNTIERFLDNVNTGGPDCLHLKRASDGSFLIVEHLNGGNWASIS